MYPIREGRRAASFWPALTLVAIAALPWSPAWPQAPSPRAATPPSPRALVDQYCVVCHNQKTSTAGVCLQASTSPTRPPMPPSSKGCIRKVSAGEMPPAGMPRPAAPVLAAFTKSLADSLDRAAAANPNPGRPAVHRLNRAEYSNAIRDVLALDIQPGSLLPIDDSGYGFDNIGDVLSISPALLERYMSVARMIAREAVGNTNIKPGGGRVRRPTGRTGNRRARPQ